MDGFTYSNIFETKGIEYIAIIVFFMALIPFWYFLNKRTGINQKIRSKPGILSFGSIKVPQGVFFSRNHTWTYLEKTGSAKVGIDDLIIHLTGNVKFEKVLDEGEKVSKGEHLASISKEGKQLKIFSPITGVITQKNSELINEPHGMIEDAFNTGWLCRIKPFKWIEETNSYYLAEKANEWTISEIERFKDFLSVSMSKYSTGQENLILQSGGELVDQPLADLSIEVWNDFQKQFLDTV